MAENREELGELPRRYRSVLSDVLAAYAAFAAPGFFGMHEALERPSDSDNDAGTHDRSAQDVVLSVLSVAAALTLLLAVAVAAGFIR
jgi:hypothetical protein